MVYRVTFFASGNLSYWAGVEKSLYYYCLYSPKDFDVKIINNPYLSKSNIPPDSIKDLFANADIVDLNLETWNILSLYPRLYNFLLRTVVLEKIFMMLEIIKHKKDISRILENADLIYLIQNSRSDFLHRKNGKPVIVGSEHIYDFYSLGKSSIFKRAIFKLLNAGILDHNIDKIHLISNASFELFKRNPKFFCVPNGVDTSVFKPSINPHVGKIKLLFASRLESSKGILELLDAFYSIDTKNFDLYIAGNGSLADVVKQKKRENIHILGFVSEDRLRDLFMDADVLVFPTKAESFPLVVLEALSSGLFVLTTEVLKTKFNEVEHLNSIEYVQQDTSSISKGLKNIESKIDLIRNLDRKKNVHEFMLENYDWKVVVEKLFADFRKFIDT